MLGVLANMQCARLEHAESWDLAVSSCCQSGLWQRGMQLAQSTISGQSLGISALIMECEHKELLQTEHKLWQQLASGRNGGMLPKGLSTILNMSADLRRLGSNARDDYEGFLSSVTQDASYDATSWFRRKKPEQLGVRRLLYANEMALLQRVLVAAEPGNPGQAAEAMDKFGADLAGAGGWAKFAGGTKAAALLAAISGSVPACGKNVPGNNSSHFLSKTWGPF